MLFYYVESEEQNKANQLNIMQEQSENISAITLHIKKEWAF